MSATRLHSAIWEPVCESTATCGSSGASWVLLHPPRAMSWRGSEPWPQGTRSNLCKGFCFVHCFEAQPVFTIMTSKSIRDTGSWAWMRPSPLGAAIPMLALLTVIGRCFSIRVRRHCSEFLGRQPVRFDSYGHHLHLWWSPGNQRHVQ